jgi:hypothetical protein
LFTPAGDDGTNDFGYPGPKFKLDATTGNQVKIYEYCIDVTLPLIPDFEIHKDSDSRQRFTVEVISIAKYEMKEEDNRPPFWVDSSFARMQGKVRFEEGEEVDLSFAGDDADSDDEGKVVG